MKKIAVVAVLVMLLISSGMASFAFQNEPKGFRGLKWGDPPSEGMEFLREVEGMMVYGNPDEKMKLGDARFYMILHTFYVPPDAIEKTFMATALYFKGEENFNILETICRVKFGEPTEEGFHQFQWTGLASTVVLTYDSVEESGFMSVGSTMIFGRYTEEKEQKQAEDAEKDW